MGFADTREKKLDLKVTAKHISDLANAIVSNKLTRNSGKAALYEMIKTGKPLQEVISSLDLGNLSDTSSLEKIISEVFVEEEKAVHEARQNPETVNYIVGKVMRKTKGKADPAITLEIIRKKLLS
jgi:aspartyl-tRNA(Asn)/glutamyl-tRNA(Gln) amidotransferase subunit B